MDNKTVALSEYVSTSQGFQYSINVKYDLYDKEKILNYIPLLQSASIIREVLTSTHPESTQRSKIIVGSYGTGKSHLAVTLLSLLTKMFPPETYSELIKKIKNICPETADIVLHQIHKGAKFLPVVLTGGEQTVTQLLLNGLQLALKEHGLEHLMPETNMNAALEQIKFWHENYPAAYQELADYVLQAGKSIAQLNHELKQKREDSYELFLKAYTHISHGAQFNPMLISEPADVYRYVAQKLPEPYGGIMVVFDEFGRYLENQWNVNQKVNLQPLQDFAEACNTSGKMNLHLFLITHKQISQYAAKHGQELVNEWRKVEGRFKSIEIITQPTKVYELMSQIIIKDESFWNSYYHRYQKIFKILTHKINRTRLFADLSIQSFENYILKGSFPLHPLTAFCLPRLSQLVAQNERTIFTFLSASDYYSLNSFLAATSSSEFKLLTVDGLFDYFETQLKSADSDERVREIWVQAKGAINRLKEELVLEAKLIKALAIMKIINLPAVLPATVQILHLAFEGSEYSWDEVDNALQRLFNMRIIFEGLSSGILEIIEPGEIDIGAELSITIPKRKHLFEPIHFLNANFRPQPVLAKRYNDEYAMTRYFSCIYIRDNDPIGLAQELLDQEPERDGFIFYLCPGENNRPEELINLLVSSSIKRAIFVVPLNYHPNIIGELFELLQKLDALKVIYKDLDARLHIEADRLELLLWLTEVEEQIRIILNRLYAPENTVIIFNGQKERLDTMLDLSKMVSKICAEIYHKTPIMNNEMINKHQLTKPIASARKKLVDCLLKPYLAPNLGIKGNGPEIAIYRSLFRAPGREIVLQEEEQVIIRPFCELKDDGLKLVLEKIQQLVDETSEQGVRMDRLIKALYLPPFGIRKGVIPILLALLMHGKNNEYQLVDTQGAERIISGDSIEAAMEQPDQFYLKREDWSKAKATYCYQLLRLFGDAGDRDEFESLPRKVVNAMRRWFVSLPKLTRDTQLISKEAKSLRKLIRNLHMVSTRMLFREIPNIFGYQQFDSQVADYLISHMRTIKDEMDYYHLSVINRLEKKLLEQLPNQGQNSLLSGLKLWYQGLAAQQKNKLYSDGTQELLNLIEGFHGENRIEFVKNVLYLLTGLRLEDWSDTTSNGIEREFAQMIAEVANVQESLEQAAGNGSNQIFIEFERADGTRVQRSFPMGNISRSGQLLHNVLRSYLQEYGDAITNNEKRNIVIKLLEELI